MNASSVNCFNHSSYESLNERMKDTIRQESLWHPRHMPRSERGSTARTMSWMVMLCAARASW